MSHIFPIFFPCHRPNLDDGDDAAGHQVMVFVHSRGDTFKTVPLAVCERWLVVDPLLILKLIWEWDTLGKLMHVFLF